MTKPYEAMSLEEIQVERAKLAVERAELAANTLTANIVADDDRIVLASSPGGFAVPVALDPVQELRDIIDKPDEEDDAPPPWPHQRMTYAGLELEVRKPHEAALIAVSMTSSEGIDGQTRMRIFTRFLRNHLSESAFAAVLEAMTAPDSDVTIQGLVTALTEVEE